MTLYEKILTIYPELINCDFAFGPITLQDDGDGEAYIAKWEHPSLTQPTESQLADVTGEYLEPTSSRESVTRRQGRLALIDVGKLAEVEGAIASIIDPIERLKAQVEYEADTWERSNEFLQGMWALLGGTESQLDDLFTLAATK